LVFVATLVAATGVQAEIMDTLERMRRVALTMSSVSTAEIDASEKVLVLSDLDGNESTLSPDNLDLMLQAISDEVEREQAVRDFMTRVVKTPDQPVKLDASLPSLYPVVTSTELAKAPGAEDLGMWHAEIAPGLSEFLVVDAPDSVSYVTQAQLDDSAIGLDDLRDRARQNLRRLAETRSFQEYSDSPWVAGYILDGFYDCSLMLLPEIWSDLSARVGELAVGCPVRGELLVVSSTDQWAIESVHAYGREAFETRAYPASPFLYLWTETGWQVLP
jgi:uncharacterized protein YtpQ (UPF0354 family)